MIATVVESALTLLPTRLVVVTGYDSPAIEAALAGFSHQIEFCLNRDWNQGMGNSLAAGVRFLDNQTRAPLMILLGDMPRLSAATIAQILTTAEQNPDQIIQPHFAGKPGHPVIWPADLRPELCNLSGDQGGKTIIINYPQRLLRLDWPDELILRDIDTVEDYERLKWE